MLYELDSEKEFIDDVLRASMIEDEDVEAFIDDENDDEECLTIDAPRFSRKPTSDLAAIRGALYVADALDAEVILSAMYALQECPEISVEQAIAIGISNWIK